MYVQNFTEGESESARECAIIDPATLVRYDSDIN